MRDGWVCVQDKSGKETNGFKSRMGSRGAAPRLLRLKPEDLGQVGGAPLQKGKFTWVTESGREERWIVASCGNYTVLWNFRCAAPQHARWQAPEHVRREGVLHETALRQYCCRPAF